MKKKTFINPLILTCSFRCLVKIKVTSVLLTLSCCYQVGRIVFLVNDFQILGPIAVVFELNLQNSMHRRKKRFLNCVCVKLSSYQKCKENLTDIHFMVKQHIVHRNKKNLHEIQKISRAFYAWLALTNMNVKIRTNKKFTFC